MGRGYLERIGDPDAVRSNAQALISFLEKLNVYDWEDLLEDMLLDPYHVGRIFLMGKETDLIPVACAFIDKLGEETKRLVVSAVENILRRFLSASPQGEASAEMISHSLLLASSLRLSIDIALLADIIARKDLDVSLRARAASVLATRSPIPPADFWTGLDIKSEPELLPAAINALSRIDASQALGLVLQFPTAPIDTGSLEYPVRRMLRRLPASEASDQALSRAGDWLRRILDQMLREPEFSRFLPPSQLASVSDFQSYRRDGRTSTFDDFLGYVRDRGWTVPIKPTGYFQDKLFAEDRRLPDCMYDYCGSVMKLMVQRAQAIGLIGEREETRIHLETEVSFPFDSIIDDVLAGKVLQSEVAFSSRKRGRHATMVAVGEVTAFGMLFANSLNSQIRASLGVLNLDPSRPVTDLRTILSYCLRESFSCIVQPSTALYEELAAEVETLGDKSGKGRRLFREISDQSDIEAILREGASSSRKVPLQMALLDYIIAQSIAKRPRMKKIKMYEVKFAPPLVAGFLVPNNDSVTAEILKKAVDNSLYRNREWNSEFYQLMRQAKVNLYSDGPKFVRLNDDLSADTSNGKQEARLLA